MGLPMSVSGGSIHRGSKNLSGVPTLTSVCTTLSSARPRSYTVVLRLQPGDRWGHWEKLRLPAGAQAVPAARGHTESRWPCTGLARVGHGTSLFTVHLTFRSRTRQSSRQCQMSSTPSQSGTHRSSEGKQFGQVPTQLALRSPFSHPDLLPSLCPSPAPRCRAVPRTVGGEPRPTPFPAHLLPTSLLGVFLTNGLKHSFLHFQLSKSVAHAAQHTQLSLRPCACVLEVG